MASELFPPILPVNMPGVYFLTHVSGASASWISPFHYSRPLPQSSHNCLISLLTRYRVSDSSSPLSWRLNGGLIHPTERVTLPKIS